MLPKVNKRTLTLGAIAFLLVGATAYDYTAGIGPRREPAAVQARLQAKHEAPRSRVADLVRETAELKYFLAHAPEIRGRYQAIAVPYAEAVATFATLYNPGESPQAVAKQRLAGLMPAGVDVSGLLVSEAAPTERGAVWLTATLSFSSKDSAAFETALLALGDPANGTLWKEMEVGSDPETRTLRASGKLLVLMVEQNE
jgi:hypothetical protein